MSATSGAVAPRGLDGGRRAERGAALLEAAISAPLLLLVIFGIMEASQLFSKYQDLSNLASQSSRDAGVFGKQPTADFDLLRSVKANAARLSVNDLDVVVVWRAASPDDTVPALCLLSSQSGPPPAPQCNRYTASDFARPTSDFGCGPTSVDRFWCPAVRKTALSGPGGPPDYIGVYFQTTHDPFVAGIGERRTVKQWAITRIEPDRR